MSLIHLETISEVMGLTTSLNIVIPDGQKVSDMPVLYLLHGLSDNYSNWERRTNVERYADEASLIIVMPEAYRSFYTDMKYGVKYFSYIKDELPNILNRLFNISNAREKTFIAGNSMGGYGALKCAFTSPEKYAGVAAFSSVADMQKTIDDSVLGDFFSNANGEITAIFGEDLKIGEQNDLFSLSEKLKKSTIKPKIFMACGTQDELYSQNLSLNEHLKKLSIEHSFYDWEDGHTWRFWDAAVSLAIDFFLDLDNLDNEEEQN